MLISVLLQVDVSRIYPHLLSYYCVLADTINYKRAFPAVLTQLISLAMQEALSLPARMFMASPHSLVQSSPKC